MWSKASPHAEGASPLQGLADRASSLLSESPLLAAGIATLILLLLRRLLRRPPPRSELYSLPNGKQIHHLRKAETDFLYKEIFRDGGYLQELTGEQELRLTLAPGDVVVDVGANIGLFAMYCAWAPEVKGDVTVLAYECVPTTHAVLQRNAALATASCPKTTVLAHGYGLSDARSSSTVHHHPNFSIWSTVRWLGSVWKMSAAWAESLIGVV
eukprot:gene11532-3036_t